MQTSGLPVVARFCRTSPQAGYEAFKELLAEYPELTSLA